MYIAGGFCYIAAGLLGLTLNALGNKALGIRLRLQRNFLLQSTLLLANLASIS